MLANIAAGTTVFVDANILIFALTNHPAHGNPVESRQSGEGKEASVHLSLFEA